MIRMTITENNTSIDDGNDTCMMYDVSCTRQEMLAFDTLTFHFAKLIEQKARNMNSTNIQSSLTHYRRLFDHGTTLVST
jgi:hypothetical protein